MAFQARAYRLWSLAALAAGALSLDNGLARTPPLGFNTWSAYGPAGASEAVLREVADLFVSTGLAAAGYSYVNMDDGWSLPNRSADGQLVADPAKFPGGVGAVADYVHSRELKLGIYTAVAPYVCSGRPGSLHHEADDAALFASFDVDYVKIDNCGASAFGDARFLAFAEAVNRTGRAMVLSTEPFNILPSPAHARFSNLWRTQADLGPSWDQILSTADMNEQWWPIAGPGAFADPDMLQCDRGEIGNGPLCRSHFAIWAVSKAPLLISTALTALTNATLDLYRNAGLLAINQDALGAPARKLAADGQRMPFFVGLGPCEGGAGGVNGVDEAALGFALEAPPPAAGTAAAAMMTAARPADGPNSTWVVKHAATGRCLGVRPWPEAGAAAAPFLLPCDAADATQLWTLPLGRGTPGAVLNAAAGGLALAVAPATAYAAAHGSDAPLPDGAYGVSNVTLAPYAPPPPCVIPHSGCNDFDPLQQWHFSALTGRAHLALYAATQEHCFSSAVSPGTCYPPPGTPQLPAAAPLCLARVLAAANAPALAQHSGQHVWGGALSDGFVVALQNRDAAAASVAARWAWLEAPGVGDGTTLCGTEVVNGTALGALVGGVELEVGARDVAVVRLRAPSGGAC